MEITVNSLIEKHSPELGRNRQIMADSIECRNRAPIYSVESPSSELETISMIKHLPQTLTLSLAGIFLALASQACLAGEGAPTAVELANATYYGTDERTVTLTDGRWEGEPYVEDGAARPSVGLVEDFYLTGDLDGDGRDEAVVTLWQSSGGSGTFNYVAVVGRKNDEITNLGTAALGDRVQVRSGRIDGDVIVFDVVQQGEGDAACCPTQLATRNWSLADNQLKEGEAKITGKLSLATLAGTEWVLTHFNRNEPILEGAKVTLAFADDKVSGKSACNRYSAGVEQGEAPGDLKIGLAMGTRMACPGELMDLESKYLDALSRVTGFSFLAGKLVLTWEKDGDWLTMVFTPR
jgi:heat shock protein HslJ